MTQQYQDELDRLTSPQAAKEEEDRRQRSDFRPPWTKATVDITGLEGPYEAHLNNGQPVTRVALKLQNMRSIEGITPFAGTEFDLELALPRPRQDGSPAQPNLNSETVQMVASAQELAPNIQSLRGLVGLKNVRLEERVHHYEGRTQKPANSGNWVDTDMTTRYYHIVSIGSVAGSNGATAPISDDRLAEAVTLITGLSHADAMTALGEDGGAVLSKLVLNKSIRQVEGLYQPAEAASA